MIPPGSLTAKDPENIPAPKRKLVSSSNHHFSRGKLAVKLRFFFPYQILGTIARLIPIPKTPPRCLENVPTIFFKLLVGATSPPSFGAAIVATIEWPGIPNEKTIRMRRGSVKNIYQKRDPWDFYIYLHLP